MSLIARISDAKNATSVRISDAFRNEKGAFDLPSIMIGVAVVAILTVGVLAAIFGVIPWAQDNAAKQDVAAVVTAQGVYNAQHGSLQGSATRYATLATLTSTGVDLLPDNLLTDKVGNPAVARVVTTPTGTSATSGFTVTVVSETGKKFTASDKAPAPVPAP